MAEKLSIPTLPRWKSIKNTFRILRNPIPVFAEYTARYGDTFKVYVAGLFPAIFTIDPGLTQHILQRNHRRYRKSEVQTESIGKYVGKGLLTIDGSYWLQQRRLIQPGFHKARLQKIRLIMEGVLDQYFVGLDSRLSLNNQVDIYEESHQIAHQIIVRSLFSDSLDEETMRRLGSNITRVQQFLIKQLRLPFLDWYFALTGQKKKYLKIARESNYIIKDYIHERRKSDETYDDLLAMLMEARYEDTGEGMSDEQLIDESLILFVAGHETSANALSWACYLLSKHPETIAKIREEESNEYLRLVINEAMRLYPPAWITDRVSLEDDHYEGLEIPQETMIVSYIYGIHHSAKHWDDPEEFRPERFNEKNKDRHPYAFMPFGGGPRLCIGNNFALMEMELTLRRIVDHYDLELVENQQIEAFPLVTLRPKPGIKMRLIRRQL